MITESDIQTSARLMATDVINNRTKINEIAKTVISVGGFDSNYYTTASSKKWLAATAEGDVLGYTYPIVKLVDSNGGDFSYWDMLDVIDPAWSRKRTVNALTPLFADALRSLYLP